MVNAHLTRAGRWQVCRARHGCSLPYHVPDMTPEAAATLPIDFLDQLLPGARGEYTSGPSTGLTGEVWYDWWEDTQGQLHRDYDLPAKIGENGDRFWYRHGKLHRSGGQVAYVKHNKRGVTRGWYEYGQWHRVAGPAVIEADGTERWYWRGELHRGGDLPAVANPDGSREWWSHGRLHRDTDKPAVIYANGTQQWYDSGQRHREGTRPAIVHQSGEVHYYKMDREVGPPSRLWDALDYVDIHRPGNTYDLDLLHGVTPAYRKEHSVCCRPRAYDREST